MKHILITLTILLLASCATSPEREMKKMTTQNYETCTFTGFGEYKTIRLRDEVNEHLLTFKWKINWDESFYDAFRENVEEGFETTLSKEYVTRNYNFLKEEIQKDKEMIAHLESIGEDYPEMYDDVSFRIYKMTYLAKDTTGNRIHNNCYGKYDKNGQMVAFKLTDESEWIILGQCVSIPYYYDILLQ